MRCYNYICAYPFLKVFWYDVKGNKSTGTQTIKIDTTEPTAETPTISSYDTDSITVSATGSDAGGSGIYSYEFQLSTTSSTSGFTTKGTTTSTSSSASYTYTGLSDGTTYYMRVVVTDKVGYTTTSTAKRQSTEVANNAPEVITEAYCSSKNTSTIFIRTAAADDDGDSLTYTLQYGKTYSYGETKSTRGGSRG